ncbi:MAG TPA: hypothetical protein DEB39_01730 [Planctomycetaceae bacterium]|nr:hypothetical protein [Planctomycetaceae bacterium]
MNRITLHGERTVENRERRTRRKNDPSLLIFRLFERRFEDMESRGERGSILFRGNRKKKHLSHQGQFGKMLEFSRKL